MKVIGIIAAMTLLVSVGYAGENYTISGEISFQYDADIYIGLYTQETYKDMTKIIPSPPFIQIIEMNPELYKAGKTIFKFVNIPKNTYGIIAFQETNENKKFDVNLWLGTSDEPFGCYKALPPEIAVPNWDVIKFDLGQDITGIEIQM
jgi:hypothetical protein